MSANELDKKVDQIRELKRLIEEAETEITGIEDEIKARMTELDTDTMRGDKCKATWKETSTTGTAYCVNHGLKGVSPSKALTVQPYNREPRTMGAFANGYPNRTLEQFKELHASDVRGIAGLTEDEYKYATQLAVWATCGQLAVPGTSFAAGSETLTEPTSDAQKIRIFDSVKAILNLANTWTKHIYTGMYLRAKENQDVRGVEVVHARGLAGAAENNVDGIKKETINGKEYYLVKEVSTDDAHIVDTNPQQIELKAGQTATQELVFFNDKLPGLHLIKVDSADLSKPIANARFRFEAVDGSWGPTELTTLEDGTIDLSKLPTGAVVVTELDCPGYVIDNAQRIIELKPNETAQFVFTNSKLPSLRLTKTSADGTPLEGVSFRLAKIEDGSHYETASYVSFCPFFFLRNLLYLISMSRLIVCYMIFIN